MEKPVFINVFAAMAPIMKSDFSLYYGIRKKPSSSPREIMEEDIHFSFSFPKIGLT